MGLTTRGVLIVSTVTSPGAFMTTARIVVGIWGSVLMVSPFILGEDAGAAWVGSLQPAVRVTVTVPSPTTSGRSSSPKLTMLPKRVKLQGLVS